MASNLCASPFARRNVNLLISSYEIESALKIKLIQNSTPSIEDDDQFEFEASIETNLTLAKLDLFLMYKQIGINHEMIIRELEERVDSDHVEEGLARNLRQIVESCRVSTFFCFFFILQYLGARC